MRRHAATVGIAFAAWVSGSIASHGQPKTRVEAMEESRREKIARLWPERQSPLVDQVNELVERGLLEGVESGKGANGAQIVLGGMRSGQGTSFGVGYRRTDLWRDRFGFRITGRGTPQLASMVDIELDFQSLRTERTFLRFYGKYENSPQMDYYGAGKDSLEENRTSYRLEDLSFDMNAGFLVFQNFRAGITGGILGVHTGAGKRGGVPSTNEVFGPEEVPGLGPDTTFLRWGGFLVYDWRDYPEGPKSGGVYGARYREYSDRDLGQFNFKQGEFEFQQFIPYFNKTRVIALRLTAVVTFEKEGQQIPFYMQPKLGGNDDLRGFQRYRFYDDHLVFASLEHRWHAFSGLDMALFVDAGKVVSEKSEIDFSGLKYSGGIGFRFRLQNAVIMRIDFAAGSEGFRFMWTFSDIYRIKY